MSLGPRLTTSVQRPISIPSPSRARSLGEQPNFPPGTIEYPCPRMIQRSSARSSTARTVLVSTKQKIARHFPALNAKRLGSLTNTPNDSVLTKEVTHSCHGELIQPIDSSLPNPHNLLNPDQSLVVYPNHPLPTTHCSFNPDRLHHPSPFCFTRIPLTCLLLGIATRTTTTPTERMRTKSPPAKTATLSGVTARLNSSVFFPQLVTLFGFFMFFSLTRISFSLAVILLFLPHDSH